MKGKKGGGVFVLLRLNWRAALGALVLAVGAAVAVTASAMTAEGVDIPVVMYHALLKDPARQGQYVITPAEFEADLIYLKKHGYTTILMKDLIAYTQGGELPEKPILLTFDDGYYNNYLYAFGIARQYGCRFVISPIGRYTDAYSETGETNAYYSHATWEQLKEMAGSGLVEVQNHSYDLHERREGALGVQRRSGEGEGAYGARISADILKAQEAIEGHIGQRPSTFVYPFGAMSEGTGEVVKGLGFQATLTCREKVSRVTRDSASLYGIGRYLRPAGISSKDFFEGKMGLKGP